MTNPFAWSPGPEPEEEPMRSSDTWAKLANAVAHATEADHEGLAYLVLLSAEQHAAVVQALKYMSREFDPIPDEK